MQALLSTKKASRAKKITKVAISDRPILPNINRLLVIDDW
jgi:hypothetical protein